MYAQSQALLHWWSGQARNKALVTYAFAELFMAHPVMKLHKVPAEGERIKIYINKQELNNLVY